MFAFLPGIPGADDVRALVRRVDTARHKGIPSGCVLELVLMSVPPETSGFDPLAMISAGGRPMVLRQAVAAIHRSPRRAASRSRAFSTATPAAAASATTSCSSSSVKPPPPSFSVR